MVKHLDDGQNNALEALLRAIAAGDQSHVFRVLDESPQLATRAIQVAATRTDSVSYFLPEISHYIYAGDTALHLAAAAQQPEIAERLLSVGADVCARNRRGAEPLHYAADGGARLADAQYAAIELLIRAGADPNAIDKSGVAPLHRAVRSRSTAAVEALLANGAEVRRQNKSGSTPLHLAVQDTGASGSGSEAKRREQAKIIRILMEHGARASDLDGSGKSVLESARSGWVRELLGDV